MRNIMTNIQHLGRSLMLPIAVLPVAAILLRLGQGDLLGVPFIAESGAAIFANLGMLFAVGIAVGFAKGNHGAAGLAGLVAYLVAFHGAEVLVHVPAETYENLSADAVEMAKAIFREKQVGKLNVPMGIMSGLIAGILYNRYHNIKLPEFLAFFGGRRFVPIAAGCAGILLAAFFGYGMPFLATGIDGLSQAIVEAGGFGLFVYGVLNRLLIITGLHHILNNVAWFIVGDFNGATGDLNRFFAGDATAGAFMSGFFPVMMFGLPAACFAMYLSADKNRRKEVAGMYVSLGLTSFLTGVTEPIEFTFMFLAPVLYGIHAVLTGVSMALMDALNIKLGFGFSAGLFDYVLSFKFATNAWMLLPVGAVYALIYFSVFRFFIVKFNLKVPGRDDVAEQGMTHGNETDAAKAYITALGGADNIRSIEACTTRLRLVVHDNTGINETALKGLGARGVIKPTATSVQVVIGPQADQVADEIKQGLVRGAGVFSRQPADPVTSVKPERVVGVNTAPALDEASLLSLLKALGGSENIKSLKVVSTRLLIELNDVQRIDEPKLSRHATRGVVKVDERNIHVLLGPGAAQTGEYLNSLLAT